MRKILKKKTKAIKKKKKSKKETWSKVEDAVLKHAFSDQKDERSAIKSCLRNKIIKNGKKDKKSRIKERVKALDLKIGGGKNPAARPNRAYGKKSAPEKENESGNMSNINDMMAEDDEESGKSKFSKKNMKMDDSDDSDNSDEEGTEGNEEISARSSSIFARDIAEDKGSSSGPARKRLMKKARADDGDSDNDMTLDVTQPSVTAKAWDDED